MKPLKMYMNSLSRYKRSKGFGIHSPFAYRFTTRVLHERLPYYAYSEIMLRRHMSLNLARNIAKHPRVISMKNAKLLFRIANFFNPAYILQIGTSYGVSTTALLDVSSKSKLIIYPGLSAHPDVYEKVTHRYGDRITPYGSIAEATSAYIDMLGKEGVPFILVNSIDSENEKETLHAFLLDMLGRNGTVILRNLTKSRLIADLLSSLDEALDHGMTFSNGNIAVIVGYSHLPRQRFLLWY